MAMLNQLRLSALQAIRAAMMQWTVNAEYQQPIHPFMAEKLPELPELHRQVALPGAKRAIHLEALEAFHQRGMNNDEIVAEINAQVDERLRHRIEQFENWRDGERAEHLAVARRRELNRRVLLAAKSAQIERELDTLRIVEP